MAVKKSATRPTTASARPPKKVTKQADDPDVKTNIEDEVARDLRLLRAILEPSTKSTLTKAPPKRPRALSSSTRARPGSNAEQNDKSAISPAAKVSLSQSEQKKLATDSFNKNLRILSLAVQERQREKAAKPESHLTPQSNPAEKKTESASEVKLRAECACAGLDVLRLAQSEDGSTDESIHKREQGAVFLLDRLISLEFEDMAYNQATKIHEQYWKRRKSQNKTSKSRNSKISIDQMILVREDLENDISFNFVCSFQSQLLRLCMLCGPRVLTQELLNNIKLEVQGSPGEVLLRCGSQGWIKSAKAGENLQVIAQSLLKMYSATAKTKEPVALHYLMESLVYKLNSADLCGRTMQIEDEVWVPVERALRHSTAAGVSISYEAIYGITKRLQIKLRESNEDSAMTAKLAEILIGLAEQQNDSNQVVELLRDLTKTRTGLQQVIYTSYLLAIELDAGKVALAQDPKDVAQMISVIDHQKSILSTFQLSAISKLRKSCARIFTHQQGELQQECPNDIAFDCFKLLIFFQRMLLAELQLLEADDKLNTLLIQAITKMTEAILDFERRASGVSTVYDVFLDEVRSCVAAFRDTVSSHNTGSEVNRLLSIKTSNVFWRAYIHSRSSKQPTSTALSLAQTSVFFMRSLPFEDLKQAALGPRLEKIAEMQAETDQSEEAAQTIKHAIEHYIKVDALTDAVETALSRPSIKVWSDPQSLAYQLGRVIRDCLALKLRDAVSEDFTRHFYVDESLPNFHQALLLSFQIAYVLKKYSGKCQTSDLLATFRKVLELADSPQYRVWRLRAASTFVYHASKNGLDDHVMAEMAALLRQQAADDGLCPQLLLKDYLLITEYCARLQLSFLDIDISLDMISDFENESSVICACEDIEALEKIIDNAEIVFSILRAAIERALATGDDALARNYLKARVRLLELSGGLCANDVVETKIRLAECHMNLEDIMDAGQILQPLQDDTVPYKLTRTVLMKLHFALAKFHLARDDLYQSQHHLSQAASNFAQLYSSEKALRSAQQIERDSYVAGAAFLSSQLASRHGNIRYAHIYARQAAKILISIWAALSRNAKKKASIKKDSSIATLTDEMSLLQLTKPVRVDTPSKDGAMFWPYAQLFINSLTHAASVLSHSGSYEDALHYYKQLQPHIEEIKIWILGIEMVLLQVRAGQLKSFRGLIPDVGTLPKSKNDVEHRNYKLRLAQLYMQCKDENKAMETLKHIKWPSMSNSESQSISIETLLVATADSKRGERPLKAGSKTVVKAKDIVHKPEAQSCLSAVQSLELTRLQDTHRALKWSLSAYTQADQTVTSMSISRLCSSPEYNVDEIFAATKYVLQQAWDQLRAESMQSVLADSAVALPANTMQQRRKRVSLLQGGGLDVNPSPVKQVEAEISNIAELLQTAHHLCTILLKKRRQYCPTDMLYALTKMDARISLLATTMDLPFVVSSTDLVLKASQPVDEAFERELMLAEAEAATRDRASLSRWPELDNRSSSTVYTVAPKQIDDLPPSWTILSITLAETEDELIISKTLARQAPFLVRIPLRRSNEGEQTDGPGYKEVKAEITDIIEQANSSSHDSRSMGEKAVRSDWHNERIVLDERLRLLLESIELVWLGGFHGIFTPHEPHEDDINQFAANLTRTLYKHLPSRQKSGFSDQIDVHTHVLKLFLGLNLSKDGDTDDAIMDLLYFVVDILQFSGEKNAYDEIDWDAMLVDTLDALNAYHETKEVQSIRHTILIIDKQLESIPWEALPCLISHPVSRMPSLATIFQRLEIGRQQSSDYSALSISKSKMQASYILNPAGDLTSTQATFEPILTSISTPRDIMLVNDPPTEAQFSDMLTSSDLLLYFGHGSGAQYIRPRTIRSLQNRAVTFLFGCSSAKMTEYGVFESVGMPRAYMLSQAPAMVGCLWDVTDREIDRVALKVLSEWGLIDMNDERVREGLKKKGKKEKGKAVSKHGKEETKQKTLVEAVRDGREACVLRYLCGAAVVVYGIPVVLDW